MNLKGIAEQLEMEESDFLEIVELFLETSALDLEELRSAVKGNDSLGALHAAHSIKGAAANLRLTTVFELAQRMEREARENHLEGATVAIQAIQESLARIHESLKQGRALA